MQIKCCLENLFKDDIELDPQEVGL